MRSLKMRNYMEDCVLDMLDPVLERMKVCRCEACRYDIAAIALNSLPPKYVVTKMGQLYAKMITLQQQFDVDIIAALTKASVIVSRSPRHEECKTDISEEASGTEITIDRSPKILELDETETPEVQTDN